MNIKHYNNSFYLIKTEKIKLVCDPWLGLMESTATWSYPNINQNLNILNSIKPNIIYISHLHTDHYDEKILKKLKNKNIQVVIKKFKDKRLKNKLVALGYKKFIELNSWQTYNFKDIELTLIPCDTSNSKNISNKIFYDLDTSILIYDKKNKISFYNNVDNPLSLKSIKKVKSITHNKYKKLDIASICPRSASEFPQCFLNINRSLSRKKIIKQCLNRTQDILNLLKPKYFVPAGGSYVIFGKNSGLQKFVAHPSLNTVKNFFKKNNNSEVLQLDCGSEVKLKKDRKIEVINKFSKLSNKQIFKKLKKKSYPYMKFPIEKNIVSLFNEAKENYFNRIDKLKVKANWKINFFLYDNLSLNKANQIQNKQKFIYKLSLSDKNYKKFSQELNCFMDVKLFSALLKKDYNWNMSIGGSLIMFERYPEKFFPDVSFSLNFLTI